MKKVWYDERQPGFLKSCEKRPAKLFTEISGGETQTFQKVGNAGPEAKHIDSPQASTSGVFVCTTTPCPCAKRGIRILVCGGALVKRYERPPLAH